MNLSRNNNTRDLGANKLCLCLRVSINSFNNCDKEASGEHTQYPKVNGIFAHRTEV